MAEEGFVVLDPFLFCVVLEFQGSGYITLARGVAAVFVIGEVVTGVVLGFSGAREGGLEQVFFTVCIPVAELADCVSIAVYLLLQLCCLLILDWAGKWCWRCGGFLGGYRCGH